MYLTKSPYSPLLLLLLSIGYVISSQSLLYADQKNQDQPWFVYMVPFENKSDLLKNQTAAGSHLNLSQKKVSLGLRVFLCCVQLTGAQVVSNVPLKIVLPPGVLPGEISVIFLNK